MAAVIHDVKAGGARARRGPRSLVDRPLRRDVRLLGRILGEVLIEREGDELFALEEKIRKLAIERRRGGAVEDAARELEAALAALPPERAVPVIRAFAVYFRLANLAEQHHRIRRARAHAREPGSKPQRGSIGAVLLEARRAGVSAEAAREAIRRLEVTLTFTAHPTQAERRTVLEKLYRVARRLEERDRTRLLPREAREGLRAIREEVTALWQTDELRKERPSVGDEVKNVLWYLEEILWDLLPAVTEELRTAFSRAYGEELDLEAPPLRLHSWVGADMDGNPSVTPEVLAEAIRLHRSRGLALLLDAVRRLGAALSQSSRYVVAPDALLSSIAEDGRRMPDIAAREESRTRGEPWRQKLRFIEARLEATLAAAQGRPTGEGVVYEDASALERDLAVVADALHDAGCARAGERQARALLGRVRALGLAIAELELRVPAEWARAGAAAIAGAAPTDPGRRFLDALRVIAGARREAGERGCRTVVLSMTENAGDVRAVLDCARACELWDAARGAARIDVVPLVETLAALDAAPEILRELLADPIYRRHVTARGVQEVMVGYSDSNKEVGLLAAAAALQRAERGMVAVAAEAGIPLRIFHGRGESVARGGGPAQQAILALPPGSVAGRYKATEQGEALDHKYARPELAMRTLELIVGGALLHTLDRAPAAPPEREAVYLAAFDELAEVGRRAYRALVWEEPHFAEFFAIATPIDEISSLPIGSRPTKRAAGGLESLRAIPWVFAWTQNRAILPGWYGVGTALSTFGRRPGGIELLREMVTKWPFFRAVVDNVEMVLAKTDMHIASSYAALAPDAARRAVWPRIRREHSRTRLWIKRLLGERRLLEHNPTLQRSIQLRNPYVDPMSFLQVELLRRKRAGDARCDRALLLTVNGIAAGMRNTG